MKSVLLRPVQLCTQLAPSAEPSWLQACSHLPPNRPLLSPPCPQTPASWPPLPCPALLPASPRLPAVLLLYTINRPQCAAGIAATAAEDDRWQCGASSRPENSCCRKGGGRGRCHRLPSEVSPFLSIMDGCGAMLKSLYSFKATYSAALTFREGEVFLELDISKSDRQDNKPCL